MESAPPPGAAGVLPPLPLRRTAQQRPLVSPVSVTTTGYPLDHPAARRWWSALLRPGAVADLLRLATAARRGHSLPRPVHLDQLVRARLVRFADGSIEVGTAFPELPVHWRNRLHPMVRREHLQALG